MPDYSCTPVTVTDQDIHRFWFWFISGRNLIRNLGIDLDLDLDSDFDLVSGILAVMDLDSSIQIGFRHELLDVGLDFTRGVSGADSSLFATKGHLETQAAFLACLGILYQKKNPVSYMYKNSIKIVVNIIIAVMHYTCQGHSALLLAW